MDNNKCQEAWIRDDMNITKNMICAWHSSDSACNGDSGGPLSCQPGISNNAWLDYYSTVYFRVEAASFLPCASSTFLVQHWKRGLNVASRVAARALRAGIVRLPAMRVEEDAQRLSSDVRIPRVD